ncbi:MAG: substrate-binding domain-containing protein [Caldilineales bacterium]|nr:substrate-binding domain-containing protein [Caldilineales bacterium]
MPTANRLDQIIALVNMQGFMSVSELSARFGVSEVTIRKDLHRLDGEGRLQRRYGGAVPVQKESMPEMALHGLVADSRILSAEVDVIIATAVDPRSDRVLLDQAARRQIPIIAESVGAEGMATVVSVDNYQAGLDLGRWAGAFARESLGGEARILDLTYSLANTRARSDGFIDGVRSVLPSATVSLSINAQARCETAYQVTTDALSVHPDINIIFAINDATAAGALQACRDAQIPPERLAVFTFGLEGETMRNELASDGFCRAGLAMFPEIVARVCIEAAILAYGGGDLPPTFVTPHAVLTPSALSSFYENQAGSWRLRWDESLELLDAPLPINVDSSGNGRSLPSHIGFVVAYREHEWYQNLQLAMTEYTAALGIDFVVVDADQNVRDELTLRKNSIAALAAQLVAPGDVIIIDVGQVTTCLAVELAKRSDIIVITNAVSVFDALRRNPGLDLVSTGGLLRADSQTLVGPTAESVLRDLRADKLFLTTSGISLEFGLSHTNLAEVSVKQAMIRAAREVILLADHTKFEQEAVVQVAGLDAVDRLITDNALPASVRLDLTKLGIEIMMAST